ncbi:MAG: glycosyltransferase family 4 protein, partial [Gloeomargarita sp. SKYB31]|nr:glycosyltransferase family 4 protein [Gloeomargarita sp. SKYB31]
MNIFILTSELYPETGGIAQYVKNFSEALVKAGHQVVVFGFSDRRTHSSDELTVNGVTIIPLKRKPFDFPYTHMSQAPAQSYQIAEAVINYIQRNGKPDVIESQEYLALSYFLLQRKLQGEPALENVPIVLTLHSAQYQTRRINGFPEYQLPAWWEGCMEKWCLLAADGMVGPSHFILRETEQELRLSLKNAEVIPLVFDPVLATGLNYYAPTPT